MRLRSNILSIGLTLALASLARADAPSPTPTPPAELAPEILLRTFGKESWAAVPGEPILLAVTLSNPDATNQATVNAQNERLLEQLKKEHALPTGKDAKERFEKEYGPQPVAQIQLDPAGQGLAQEITFRVTQDGKEITSLAPRILSRTLSLKGPAVLADNNSLLLYFGFDDGKVASSATEKSPCVIEAVWKGHPEIKSNPVKIYAYPGGGYFGLVGPKLPPDEIDARDYLSGRYYLFDAHPEKAEDCAQRLLARNPDSGNGLELHADALAGQGKLQEAYLAFQLTHAARQKQGDEEQVSYATRRLWDLEGQIDKK